QQLLQERAALDSLLTTLAQTIDYYEGEKTMTDQEKFSYFKEQKFVKTKRTTVPNYEKPTVRKSSNKATKSGSR
ncbi:hypothetical protein KWH76_24290, partial [Enterobacter roggenkampii]|nr:hypothetical protein [Enterobacter roggenkampii]